MTEAVTAVGTSVLVFVPFGQLVMSYRHLRLLNDRRTTRAGAATVVDMNELARSFTDGRGSCGGRWVEQACHGRGRYCGSSSAKPCRNRMRSAPRGARWHRMTCSTWIRPTRTHARPPPCG